MSCLMSFRPEERRELQSPALEATAAGERAAILGLHERVFGPRGDLAALRLAAVPEDTLWAACMVNSRSFSDAVSARGGLGGAGGGGVVVYGYRVLKGCCSC